MSFSALDPQLVQDLPLDISKYILETTALLDRTSAMNLALLSKTVHCWINPILYRTIVLESDNALHSFARSIRYRNLAEFYRANVKTLYIAPIQPAEYLTRTELEDVQLVLSICTGVVNLALWVSLPDTLLPFFLSKKIVWLPKCMSFLHLPPKDISYILPPSLTLLDIQLEEGKFAFSESTWNTLFLLCPNLTTLLFNDGYDSSAASLLYVIETASFILSSPHDSLQSIIFRPNVFEHQYGVILDHFEALKNSRIVMVPPSHIPNQTMTSIERRYPGMVFFLPEVTDSWTDEHHLADWTSPAPAPHAERLWERVEKWKQGGRRPTVSVSSYDALEMPITM